jgi:hypothetical protein
MLLAIDTKSQLEFMNDMTAEGAVILMEKIGVLLDQKLEQIKDSEKSRDQDTVKKIESTFSRFHELTTNESVPQLSNRIKLLIKNMLDNRATGWERSKK